MTGKWVDMQGKLDLVGVRESSLNMTRGGGGGDEDIERGSKNF